MDPEEFGWLQSMGLHRVIHNLDYIQGDFIIPDYVDKQE